MICSFSQPFQPEPVDDPTDAKATAGAKVERAHNVPLQVEMVSTEYAEGRHHAQQVGGAETGPEGRRGQVPLQVLLEQAVVGPSDEGGKTEGVDDPPDAENSPGQGVDDAPDGAAQVVVVKPC